MDNSHFIFVYGTLKDGRHIPCMINGDLYNLGAFPGAININQSENFIYGEFHEVSDIQLARLDRYESVPHLYKRIQTKIYSLTKRESGWIQTELLGNKTVWVYEYAKKITPSHRLIESGIWVPCELYSSDEW